MGEFGDFKSAIRSMILAGKTMKDIALSTGCTIYAIRKIRNETFDELRGNSESLKGLANGAILNPNEVIHWKDFRRAPPSPDGDQLSILDIC